MSQFPELDEFPDNDGPTGHNLSLAHVHDGFGLMVSQDGDDLYKVNMTIALGPSPQNGFICSKLDAEGARQVAAHLLHLANYAELGVEAETRSE